MPSCGAGMMAAIEAYVGLGSNVGNPEGNVRSAGEILAEMPGVHWVELSSLWETPPWGYLDQPRFVNAVARVRTELGPLQLLIALKSIEYRLGRHRTFRWGPREIDLDLLLFGDAEIRRPGLTVPHPAMYQRAFVLVPLRELWPDHRSASGLGIDQAIARLSEEAGTMTLIDKRPSQLVR